METTILTEPIVCGSCLTPALVTVVESIDHETGLGPCTWRRVPPGWWMLGIDETYRCSKCLTVNKETVPWPEKPALRVVNHRTVETVGSSSSPLNQTSNASSSKPRKPTGSQSVTGSQVSPSSEQRSSRSRAASVGLPSRKKKSKLSVRA